MKKTQKNFNVYTTLKENKGKDNHLWNQIRKQQAIETDKLLNKGKPMKTPFFQKISSLRKNLLKNYATRK